MTTTEKLTVVVSHCLLERCEGAREESSGEAGESGAGVGVLVRLNYETSSTFLDFCFLKLGIPVIGTGNSPSSFMSYIHIGKGSECVPYSLCRGLLRVASQ